MKRMKLIWIGWQEKTIVLLRGKGLERFFWEDFSKSTLSTARAVWAGTGEHALTTVNIYIHCRAAVAVSPVAN